MEGAAIGVEMKMVTLEVGWCGVEKDWSGRGTWWGRAGQRGVGGAWVGATRPRQCFIANTSIVIATPSFIDHLQYSLSHAVLMGFLPMTSCKGRHETLYNAPFLCATIRCLRVEMDWDEPRTWNRDDLYLPMGNLPNVHCWRTWTLETVHTRPSGQNPIYFLRSCTVAFLLLFWKHGFPTEFTHNSMPGRPVHRTCQLLPQSRSHPRKGMVLQFSVPFLAPFVHCLGASMIRAKTRWPLTTREWRKC